MQNLFNLCQVIFLHVASLVGQTAPPEVLQKLTYLVLRHHPKIKRVDTVRAYTFGVLYFVEVSLLHLLYISSILRSWSILVSGLLYSVLFKPSVNTSGWYWAAGGFTIERSSYNRRIIADQDWRTPWSWASFRSSWFRVWSQARTLYTHQAPKYPLNKWKRIPMTNIVIIVILMGVKKSSRFKLWDIY